MSYHRDPRFSLAALAAGLLIALALPAAAEHDDDWDDPDEWEDVHYHDDGSVCDHDRDYFHEPAHGPQAWNREHHDGWGYDQLRRGEGVVVFSEPGFRGRATLFDRDVHALHGTRVGNDTASSILVARGCKAILYEHRDFRGRSVEILRDVADLGRTPLGHDRLTSMRVDCRGGWDDGWRGDRRDQHRGERRDDRRDERRDRRDDRHGPQAGVLLFEHQNYRGKSAQVTGDVIDLNPLYMNDMVSSIRLPRDCEVTLYEHQNYRGKSYRLSGDVPDLNRVQMNDIVSSLRIDCPRR